MLDYTNEYGYINNSCDQNTINQYIETEVLRRTVALEENSERLKQAYNRLYDRCNEYYQSIVLGVE